MKYYDLKICINENQLSHRSYVLVKISGQRFKEYSGKCIGIDLFPNKAKSINQKRRLLERLHRELIISIEQGNYPSKSPKDCRNDQSEFSIIDVLKIALDQKLAMNLNLLYKRNLIKVHDEFQKFILEGYNDLSLSDLDRVVVQKFLSMYNSSGTYYMNKRRDLNVLFSQASKNLGYKIDAARNTDRRKSKAQLHKIYSGEKMNIILDYLKECHFNLYLCCLLSYGCLLRPHHEIRLLRKRNFNSDYTLITLSGDENKSGRIRIVNVPIYIQVVIKPILDKICDEDNIFTRNISVLNLAYFNTAWTRYYDKLKQLGFVEEKQTIYSFRHTAAVNVYTKTKDLHILQQLLGHSDMIVTLKYLRGLGVTDMDKMKSIMPEL